MPAWSTYANPGLGIQLQYPSDWQVHEDLNTVAFTRPDGLALIALDWQSLGPGQTSADLMQDVVSHRLEQLSDAVVVPIEHEGGEPAEALITGE